MDFKFPVKKNISILALGAESAGNFSAYSPLPNHSPLSKGGIQGGSVYLSPDFGDILEEKNWQNYKKAVLKYLKDKKISPKIILTDLHPLFKTTALGKELSKKFKAEFIQVQHHHAHIFSAIGDKIINSINYKLQAKSYCIAMDGTGLGTDGKIWGGEAFAISNKYKIQRVGHLENQILIGGDLPIQEPARMLIGILSKFLNKKEIYLIVKKYYNQNEFELLYNQLQQKFNCLETSSTGRVLDATSLLLGFCDNKRNYKHEPIDLLEKNSTTVYKDLKPKIIFNKKEKQHILLTTPLFKYLTENISKDKKRLAATAQIYIAQGLHKIITLETKSQKPKAIFISGGLANNKIISSFLESKGAYGAKKIPRGDAGLSFGQIIYYLFRG